MTDSTDAAGRKGGRGFMVFLVGLAVGVAGTVFLPDLLSPYMPQSLRGADHEVAGVVTAKERQEDELLLTVDSPSGAVLATFSRKVAEISLLVDEGDSVTLSVSAVEPFVDDPTIRQVHKVRLETSTKPLSSEVGREPAGSSLADSAGAGDQPEGSAAEGDASSYAPDSAEAAPSN